MVKFIKVISELSSHPDIGVSSFFENASMISMKLKINDMVPHKMPNTIKNRFTRFCLTAISFSKSLLYIIIGKTNAKPVHAKAPERLMKRPNLGMIYAKTALIITINVLKTMFFMYGLLYFSNGFGVFLNRFPFSVISNAGTICIGKVPKRPRQ